MPKYVRAREGTGVLVHPESGAITAPDPGRPLPDNDPLVKAFPWAFVSDEDLASEQAAQDESWRESAIESARRADEAIATREQAQKEADAEGVRLAKERAGDDAPVESATKRPGEKSAARRTAAKKKA